MSEIASRDRDVSFPVRFGARDNGGEGAGWPKMFDAFFYILQTTFAPNYVAPNQLYRKPGETWLQDKLFIFLCKAIEHGYTPTGLE